MNTTLNIGQNIKKIRELKQYTQEYMAGQLGISQRSYSSLENESKKIDTERLTKISEILEVSVFDLINFNERFLFTNNNCAHSGVGIGMFNTVHQGTAKQLEMYEGRMKQMDAEIQHLRTQVNFLQELIQKQINGK